MNSFHTACSVDFQVLSCTEAESRSLWGCISKDRHLRVRLPQIAPCIFRTQMSKLLSGQLVGSKGFRSLLPGDI